MTGTDVLGLGTRRRLLATVQSYPGLHVRELARQMGTSSALVEYHLSVLVAHGLVRVADEPGYKRVYPSGTGAAAPTAQERRLLAALRKPLPLRITLFLLDHDGPLAHGQVAEGLGIGKSKLSFHLRALESAGVVRRTRDGSYEPQGRERLLELLLAVPPTPDLRREFGDLWDSLYGGG